MKIQAKNVTKLKHQPIPLLMYKSESATTASSEQIADNFASWPRNKIEITHQDSKIKTNVYWGNTRKKMEDNLLLRTREYIQTVSLVIHNS